MRTKRWVWGNPFLELDTRATRRRQVIGHIVREHARGRHFAELVTDPYVRALTTPSERQGMLEEPALMRALLRDYRALSSHEAARA